MTLPKQACHDKHNNKKPQKARTQPNGPSGPTSKGASGKVAVAGPMVPETPAAAALVALTREPGPHSVSAILDSGATHHFTNDAGELTVVPLVIEIARRESGTGRK